MTPNDLAAEIYLALVRERIKGRGLDKIKDPDMQAGAERACALSDIFWTALGEYAKAKGYVPMPPAQPGQVQGPPVPMHPTQGPLPLAGASPAPGPAA